MPLPARSELPDGTPIVVRELHESDERALRTWFATISVQSRYQRFHGYTNDLSPAHWRYLTRIDNVDHVALVALHEDSFIGIARMIRLDDDTNTAEIAFLVGDAQQKRRVGSLLRDHLLAVARARDYARLTAYVLPHNLAIRKLLPQFADRGTSLVLAL